MTASGSDKKFFLDPVHGTIILEPKTKEAILQVIDTPQVQRLRRITHLGASLYTFHGAEHSRFGHAMGSMSIMNQIVSELESNQVIDIDDSVRVNAVLAALLHDVGHGPFSHVFEEVTEERYRHEAIGRRVIVESSLSEELPDPEQVARLLDGIAEEKYRWVTELLSGPIDVDKMDYLLRDSYYTGVKYGQYDFYRLFHNLGVYDDRGRLRLGVWNKGKGVLESFILARDLMFWSVYFHKTTRGVVKLIKAIFKRVIDLIDEGKEVFLESPLRTILQGQELSVEEIEELDDSTVIEHVKRWRHSKDSILSDLANRLFRREIFKMLNITGLDDGLYERRDQIEKAFTELDLSPDSYIQRDNPLNIAYALPYFDVKAKPAVLLYRDREDRVFPKEISEVSELVNAVKNIEKKERRVYSTREGKQKLQEILGL